MGLIRQRQDLDKRMAALWAFCSERNLKLPRGSGLDCALELVSHAPHFGRLKAGNAPKPANRAIHVFLLIELLRTRGLTKATAVKALEQTGDRDLNYGLGASRLARLHCEGHSGPFGPMLKEAGSTSIKEREEMIIEMILELSTYCPWPAKLP